MTRGEQTAAFAALLYGIYGEDVAGAERIKELIG